MTKQIIVTTEEANWIKNKREWLNDDLETEKVGEFQAKLTGHSGPINLVSWMLDNEGPNKIDHSTKF